LSALNFDTRSIAAIRLKKSQNQLPPGVRHPAPARKASPGAALALLIAFLIALFAYCLCIWRMSRHPQFAGKPGIMTIHLHLIISE
jgi:hypothetical protein